MKKLKIITLLLAIGTFVSLPATAQKTEWIKATTPIFVELKEEVSSEDAVQGQKIEFTVTDQVMSENNVEIVATGAMAYGRVRTLTEYEMEIEVQFVKSVTGKMINVEAPPLKNKRTKRQCCVIFKQNTSISSRVKDNTALIFGR